MSGLGVIEVGRPSLIGLRFIETVTATARYEDWSACRSRARAERRLKRGFPQRMVIREKPAAYQIGGAIYIHPELARQLQEVTAEAPRRVHESSNLDD